MRFALFVFIISLFTSFDVAAHQVYADTQGLSAQKVLEKNGFKDITPWKSFGATKDTYWILLTDLKIIQDEQFWLFIGNSAIDHIEVYKLREHKSPEKMFHVGDVFEFDQRPIDHRAFLLPFNLNENDQLLIKVWGDTPLAIDLKYGPATDVFSQISKDENFLKIIFGIMTSLLIYNIVMFLVTRITEYFWYCVYMGGIVLFVVFLNGVGYQYIWPNSPNIQSSVAFFFICLFQFGAFGFTRTFLNLKSVSIRFDQFYKIASFVPLLMVLAIFINKEIALKVVSLTTLILFVVVPAAIILTAIRKSKSALIFLVSWMFMVVGMLTINLTINGTIPLTFFNLHALEFGVAIESVLLSFALAYRIRNKQEASKIKLQVAYEKQESALLSAKCSNHAKDSFLTSVSHELKTPLHSLLGAVQLLNLNIKNESEQTKDLLNTADTSASKLFLHIDKLLIFSEVIAGDAKKIDTSIDLKNEIEVSKKQWEMLGQGELNSFECEIQSPLPQNIKTDWVHCNKIIMIALASAFHHEKKNDITLSISSTKTSLNFIITGKGKLNDESLLQWLNAQELPQTWSEVGFGLYLCQKMANLIEAKLGFVQSETSWELTFDNPITIESEKKSNKDTNFSDKKILVVDDILVNLKVMEALIKALGAKPVLVDGGQKAINMLDNEEFDLVLMDCQMPDISGQETTKLIRESNSTYCDIPIIAVTANAQDQDRLNCEQVGMNDFIAKPIRLPILSTTLIKWL